MEKEKNCEVCFKIKCKNCGWESGVIELPLVISGKLTKCPCCGGGK